LVLIHHALRWECGLSLSVEGGGCVPAEVAPRQAAVRHAIVHAHPTPTIARHSALGYEQRGGAERVPQSVGPVGGTLAETLCVSLLSTFSCL
jgi:hypothetical protein